MKKSIIVSALGPAAVQERHFHCKAMNFMQSFWTKQLDQVLPDQPDLIVLPEACDRFSGHSPEERYSYYRERGNTMLDFFCKTARNNHCWIAYSAVMPEPDGTFHNTTNLIDRTGKIAGFYHKNFLPCDEMAEQKILCGEREAVIETEFGKTGMLICFDLNFYDLLERYAAHHPALMLFSSLFHGGLMQNHWAYRCRSYFVAAVAGNECAVLNPLGKIIAASTNYSNFVTTSVNLDYQVIHLDCHEEKLKAVKKKYGRGVTIFDPGHLGSVLLTSELEGVSSAEILEEFRLMTWDDYYGKAVKYRGRQMGMSKQ